MAEEPGGRDEKVLVVSTVQSFGMRLKDDLIHFVEMEFR